MNRPEQNLQIAFVRTLRLLLPREWLLFAVPNGGDSATRRAHGIRKAMGVLAGVPDLVLIGPGKAVFMELKAPPKRLKSGKLSDAGASLSEAQHDVIETLAQAGFPVLVVRDIDQAVAALCKLGVPLRGRSM